MKHVLIIPFITFMTLSCAAMADAGESAAEKTMAESDATKVDLKEVMKHVNTMPNLMPIVIRNMDMLNLTDEQKAGLKEWREQAGPKVNKMAKQIIAAEKELHDATLANESKEKLGTLTETILKNRQEIMDTKIGCRDNMRKILNDDQWNQVVALYTADHE